MSLPFNSPFTFFVQLNNNLLTIDSGTIDVTPTSRAWSQIAIYFSKQFSEPPLVVCYLYNQQILGIDYYTNVVPDTEKCGIVFYPDQANQKYTFYWMAIGKGITT